MMVVRVRMSDVKQTQFCYDGRSLVTQLAILTDDFPF